MTSDYDGRVKEIAMAIEAYLAAHPNAGDTLEGVLSWWLVDQPSVSRQCASDALDALIARRVVEQRKTEGGAVLYVRARREQS
jgi:hypothetical protein